MRGLIALPEPIRLDQYLKRAHIRRLLSEMRHEIARTPNWFQQKCASDTRAEYRPQSGSTVQVINRCRSADGTLTEAIGEARRVGGPDSARLEVRFAPAWLSWLPFVWGDYWVIDLDPEYQLVAVSEPQREYLWVLARQPQVVVRAGALRHQLRRLLVATVHRHRLRHQPHARPGHIRKRSTYICLSILGAPDLSCTAENSAATPAL